ncbi:MAG: hypothetical protein C5B54_05680 [Acidobacteria bacterium]|nr:MAG: hypothetical protein C5B54_05680 [Acidobacteriota bacterium]
MGQHGKTQWWIVGVLFLGLLGSLCWLGIVKIESTLRTEIIQAIEERFDAKASIENIDISLFPSVQMTGTRLVLWRGTESDPPLIKVDRFTIDSDITKLRQRPIRIHQLVLENLVIQIPPKDQKQHRANAVAHVTKTAYHPVEANRAENLFLIENIQADGTILKIIPRDPDKDPLLFELFKLNLMFVERNRPMQFQAILKNAKPPGLIETNGTFGPWQKEDPGTTPVSGNYTFGNADLSVFQGISGKLSSTGQFRGALNHIEASGTTDTPDFAVGTGNHPVHLTTKFDSIIDGTNGDTLLQPVLAHFENSDIECRGGVVKRKGIDGKFVILNVKVTKGRAEDFLRLVVPGRALMVGGMSFAADLEIPPGNVDIVKKIKLKGNFQLANAEFTSDTVQNKIETLSKRSRGIHDEETNERIVSNMQGTFQLGNGSISFSRLLFTVPGSHVDLKGSYGLITQKLDFHGTLQMQAKLSQTQTGVKSLLLKLVDPFFKKGKAGAVLPIKITGERSNPQFGLELGR